jgi:hypothetical protein
MAAPRLRGHRQAADTLYPLGEIPSDIVTAIGKELLWTIACGETDIAGDRWSEMFAAVIGVPHTKSNNGLADVTCRRTAWSAKTVNGTPNLRAKRRQLLLSAGYRHCRCAEDRWASAKHLE